MVGKPATAAPPATATVLRKRLRSILIFAPSDELGDSGHGDRVEERIVGTKGHAFGYGEIHGPNAWKFEADEPNPYVQEHADLIASIRAGKPLNEGRRIAESTMCAIMGRMSAYTGRAISWDWAMNASKLDLTPKTFEFGPNPVGPVAVPGVTKLI